MVQVKREKPADGLRTRFLAKIRGRSPAAKGQHGSTAAQTSEASTDVAVHLSQDTEPGLSQSERSGHTDLSDLHFKQLSFQNASISETLWAQAYANLEAKQPGLMSNFQEYHFGQKTKPADRMDQLIRQIYSTHRSSKVWEASEKIIQFIWESKNLVTAMASAEPHAALAWGVISQIFPLLLNQKEQSDHMTEGIEKISSLLRIYRIKEDLYLNKRKAGTDRNFHYEEAVLDLYHHILEFQARLVSHLWKAPIKRAGINTVKADDWKGWLVDIEKCDAKCLEFTQLLDTDAERSAWEKRFAQADVQASTQRQMLDALEVIRREHQEDQDGQQRQKLLHSLSSDYEEGKNFNPERVKGTCQWFLDSNEFQRWRNTPASGLLWAFAGPGCGKSVLARCLIDERLVTTNLMASTVCYFFFKDGQEGRRSRADAMKALTHQLLRWNPTDEVFKLALERYRVNGDKFGSMFGELWRNFLQMLQLPTTGEVVCIIDALDECDEYERKMFLDQLTKFYENVQNSKNHDVRLKMLITSRMYADIETKFSLLGNAAAFVKLDGEDHSDQISNEVNLVIDHRIPLIAPSLSERDQAKTVQHLKDMENRTYLWLYLIFDVIEEKMIGYGTEKGLKTVIDHLPKTVNDAYESTLGKSKEPDIARKILLIILAANTPLTVPEMNVALALTEQEDCTSYSTLDRPPDAVFRSRVKQICGLFVSIHDGKIYLLHQTAREFLISRDEVPAAGWRFSMSLGKGDGILFRICVILLSFKELKHLPSNLFIEESSASHIDRYLQWLEKHILLRYAAEQWLSHYEFMSAGYDEGLINLGLQLCNISANKIQAWWPALSDYNYPEYYPEEDGEAACAVGWYSVAEVLLEREIEVRDVNSRSRSWLYLACQYGHEPVARLLLEHSVDFNRHDPHSERMPELHIAAREGHEAIVRLLLEYEANINLNSSMFRTALSGASYGGHVATVRLLIASGADINAEVAQMGTALLGAIARGKRNTARLLWDHGARLFREDCVGAYALGYKGIERLTRLVDEVEGASREETLRIMMDSDWLWDRRVD